MNGHEGERAFESAGLTLSVASATALLGGRSCTAPGHRHFLRGCLASGDQLVAFERMDGADLVTISLAKDKAFTALVNHMPTSERVLMAPSRAPSSHERVSCGCRTIVFGGGLPIEMAGVPLGAVGVSGGSAEQDEASAAAGLESAGGG